MHRFVVAALVLAFSPSLSRAQAEPSVGDRPGHFIVVEIGPTTSLGFGWRASPRTDVSLEGGVRVSDEGDNSSRAFSLRPALKWYLGSTEGSVAPYLTVGANAEWSRVEFGGGTTGDLRRLGGIVGIGLDWFPTQRVSLGGHIGLEALAIRREGPNFPPAPAEVITGHDVGTRSSGVRLRLFF
jgi:hypothetical protein